MRRFLVLARIQGAALMAALPVWGALVAVPGLPVISLIALSIIGLAAHIYGFVLNEVVDLPVDALSADLGQKPLVSGQVKRRTAIIFAAVQVPVMFGLGVATFGPDARLLGILTGSILLATAYDLWGKRFPVAPPVGDLCLASAVGLGFLYGALAALLKAGPPLEWEHVRLPLLLTGEVVLMLIFMNGVLGGLKDADHDVLAGARTTATWLGVELRGKDLVVPRQLVGYAWGLKGFWALVMATPLLLGWLGYRAFEAGATAIALGAIFVLVAVNQHRFVRTQTPLDREALKRAAAQSEILTYWASVALLWFRLGPVRALAMMILPVVWYIATDLLLFRRLLPPVV